MEANGFAAELLMPRDVLQEELLRIHDRLKNRGDVSSLIRELADAFQVSRQAMEYKLSSLGVLSPR